MKYKIGRIAGDLIFADVRDKVGDPVIIKPDSIVELSDELLDAISHRLSKADFSLVELVKDEGGFLDLKPKKGK